MKVFSGIDRVSEGLKDVVINPSRDEPTGTSKLEETSPRLLARLRKFEDWKPSRHDLESALQFLGNGSDSDLKDIASQIDRLFIQDSDWFSRIWCVQELACSKNPWIQIGSLSVWWDRCIRTMCWLAAQYSTFEGMPAFEGILLGFPSALSLEKVRIGWSTKERPPLNFLIGEFRHRKATEPRDKIYALLGLMGDPMNDLLRPNYEDSLGTVYANTTRHFIGQYSSLDSICGWQTHGKTQGLPSWVPDYTLDQVRKPYALVPVLGHSLDYNASSTRQPNILSGAPDALIVSGIPIDRVKNVNARYPSSPPASNLEDLDHQLLDFADYLDPSSLDFICEAVATDLNPEDKNQLHHIWHNLKVIFDDNGGEVRSIREPICDIGKAYFHTMFTGRLGLGGQRLDDEIMESVLANDGKVTKAVKVKYALHAGIYWRRMALTEGSHLGALPMDAQAGDIICVLLGCSVPVVLRERDDGSYEFVGECYLYGFMDREAITLLEENKREEEVFELR